MDTTALKIGLSMGTTSYRKQISQLCLFQITCFLTCGIACAQSEYIPKAGYTHLMWERILGPAFEERDAEQQNKAFKIIQNNVTDLLTNAIEPAKTEVASLFQLLSQQEWKDKSGSFSVKASFKRFLFSESSVVLVTADGKEITVPIGRLGANERKRLTTITKQLRSHTRKYENSLAEHLKRGRSDSYGSFAYRALLPDWAAAAPIAA